jgi:hypothetical protein
MTYKVMSLSHAPAGDGASQHEAVEEMLNKAAENGFDLVAVVPSYTDQADQQGPLLILKQVGNTPDAQPIEFSPQTPF